MVEEIEVKKPERLEPKIRVDNSNAKLMMKELYNKTHFKGVNTFALRGDESKLLLNKSINQSKKRNDSNVLGEDSVILEEVNNNNDFKNDYYNSNNFENKVK